MVPPEDERRPGQGASSSPGDREAPNDAKSVARPRVALNIDGIPPELRAPRNWLAWRLKPPKKPGDKFGKVPIDPSTGRNASTTNPKTWGTFAGAVARMQQDNLAGIGFVFTESGYVGVDIDHCRDAETGAITAEAVEIIEIFDTYSEVSPSGTGVHLFVRGKLPGNGRRKGDVEIYDTGRFFTMTGVPMPGAPITIAERQEAVSSLYARLGQATGTRGNKTNLRASEFSDLDDDDLLRRAMSAKNGAKFSALWSGQTDGYSSASEADLALCRLLAFWTRCDPVAVDRLFRQSGLYRPKWDEKHGDQTYGQLTIQKALSSTGTGRSEGRKPASGDEPAGVGIPLTDTGNAERLVERFGTDLRFCHPWKKWLVWDGKRWRVDERSTPMALSKRIARSIYSEAAACSDPALRESTSKWARTSEKAERRKAMVELARSEANVPIVPEQLDQHQMLLNCPNGTIDLRTGEWHEHQREQYLTKVCPTMYKPDAQCPQFLKLIERILPEPEVQEYIQRFFGYSLTGDVSEQVIQLGLGDGQNGKSTFYCSVQSTLGRGYAIQIATELLLAKDRDSHPTELADLFGVRLAIGTETPKGRTLNETLVKLLTGGELIRARRMREDFWEFPPTHKLVLVTNHMPKVSIDSFAMLRRLHVVPFEVRIQKDEIDKLLPQKLRKEREGVLAWCVRGCRSWMERGLDPPAGMLFQPAPGSAATKQPVEEFIELYVVRRAGARTGATAVFTAFLEWCASTGSVPCSQKEFGTVLGHEGFGKQKSGGRDVYLNMALAWPGSPIQGPSGTIGDLRPVDSLGVLHEGMNGKKVPEDPQRSPEPENLSACRACAGTRVWRRLGSSTEWFCARCAPPVAGIETEVRDA